VQLLTSQGKLCWAKMSNLSSLRFHHLGLAVETPEPAGSFLAQLGYTLGEPVFDPLQNVRLTLCEHPSMPAVEIICKGDGKGPLDRLLVKHPEGLVYHICFTTTNLERTLLAFSSSGLRAYCVSPPKPAVLFGGKAVSFYQIVGMGLIELLDEGHS
jgi:Glyoxalase/Bleomycin resistance protein/Dioxygenase superfamily